MCWQFDVRLIANLRDAIKSMATLFQNPFCTYQDLDYCSIIIESQESYLAIISLLHKCGVHVTVYKYEIVSLHAQDDVNKCWVLFCVCCDVKLHFVQYAGVCIRCAKLEDIVKAILRKNTVLAYAPL